MTIDFSAWTKATTDLPWGAQSVFMSTLEAVRDGQVRLAHSADYSSSGVPCLVNATATMLSYTKGEGGNNIPIRNFREMVIAFDNVNYRLYIEGVNTTPGEVSPLAAEVLIKNFGPMKDKPFDNHVKEAFANVAFEEHVYIEPTDDDIMRDFVNSIALPPVTENVVNIPISITEQIDWDEVERALSDH